MLALVQARMGGMEGLTRKQVKEKESIEADHKFWKTQVSYFFKIKYIIVQLYIEFT